MDTKVTKTVLANLSGKRKEFADKNNKNQGSK
jgi:hypothetical protein